MAQPKLSHPFVRVTARLLLKQRQYQLGLGIRLRQNGYACLLQYLSSGQLSTFLGEIRVEDTRPRCSQVLNVDGQ